LLGATLLELDAVGKLRGLKSLVLPGRKWGSSPPLAGVTLEPDGDG
jgi:hypothetical protein